MAKKKQATGRQEQDTRRAESWITSIETATPHIMLVNHQNIEPLNVLSERFENDPGEHDDFVISSVEVMIRFIDPLQKVLADANDMEVTISALTHHKRQLTDSFARFEDRLFQAVLKFKEFVWAWITECRRIVRGLSLARRIRRQVAASEAEVEIALASLDQPWKDLKEKVDDTRRTARLRQVHKDVTMTELEGEGSETESLSSDGDAMPTPSHQNLELGSTDATTSVVSLVSLVSSSSDKLEPTSEANTPAGQHTSSVMVRIMDSTPISAASELELVGSKPATLITSKRGSDEVNTTFDLSSWRRDK